MWRAYIDESESDHVLDPDVYILAAALVPESDHDAVRATLVGLLRPGQRKLHWHAESARSRRTIVKTLAELDVLHVIVVRASDAAEPVERRRRKCFERLAHELHQRDVPRLIAEARERKQNSRELLYFNTLRTAKVISTAMRLDHVPGPREPLLWIPDAAAGTVTAARTGDNQYLETLTHLVDLVEVDAP